MPPTSSLCTRRSLIAYRSAVEDLTNAFARVEELTPVEAVTTRANLRAVIDLVTVTPLADAKRGMHVDIEGRLQSMMALATGQLITPQLTTVPVVAEEGLEPPTRGL